MSHLKKMLAALGAAVLTLTACTFGEIPGLLPNVVTDGNTGLGGQGIISGRITHLGETPSQIVTLGLKRDSSGSNTFQKLPVYVRTDKQGNYTFRNLSPGRYQVYYDDGGEEVTDAQVNTFGVWVSDAVDIDDGAVNVSFDIGWEMNPWLKPNQKFTPGSTIAFSSVVQSNRYEYQILVADSYKKSVWSSAWQTGTGFTWNGNKGSETNDPTGSYSGTGPHYYLIKVRRNGWEWGRGGAYGQSKWIPFRL